MLVAGGLSLFVSIGLWFMSEWLAAEVFNKPAMVSTLRQMSPGILGLSLATLLAMSLQGLKKVVSSLLVLNILISLVLILGVITFTVDRSSDVAFYYSAATMITFVVGGCIWLANGLGSSAGRVSWAALGASCLPLWVSTLMAQLVLFSGQFFAGIWVESEEVAQLVVAQRCAVLMSFILMAFFNFVIAPQFAEFYRKGDMVGLRGSAVYSVRLMITFALPILVLIIFFPEFILGLFGSDFIEVAVYLQILALGQFVNVITGSVGYLLTMTGHEKDIRNNMLFCGPFAIMLSLALIPFWGAIGSAIATALALSVQNLIALWLVKKRLGFSLLSEAFLVMKMAKS
jgi:O-antigen/teichoic acid export membrane protein